MRAEGVVIKPSRFFAVFFFMAVVAVYMHLHANLAVPSNRPFVEFPTGIGEWRMARQDTFPDSILNVLKPTDYVSREYVLPSGESVQLYIGYHNGSDRSSGIHSPRNCLPGSGWYEHSSRRMTLDLPGSRINLVRAVYGMNERKDMYLYWFQVRDRSLNDEYSLKLAEITGSMFYGRMDESFIRISLPVRGSEEEAMATATRFIRDFHKDLMAFIPQ